VASSIGPRRLALLAAVVLLLGQGAALHHRHEIVADHPPGPCVEHGSHAENAPPATSASVADACPFCRLLGQGRTALPAAAAGAIALPDRAVRVAGAAFAAAPQPTPTGPGARAPPRPA
jgi:hypothetical protein